HVSLLWRRAHQAPEDHAHRAGDGAELPVHPAVGFASLAGIDWPQRARGVLGREITHRRVALPDDAAAIVDGRHHAVGIHLEVPGLVVAAELAADIGALVGHAAFVGGPQHLHDVDRIGAAPDLHASSPSFSTAMLRYRRRSAAAAWCWDRHRAAVKPPRTEPANRLPTPAWGAGTSWGRHRRRPASRTLRALLADRC